MGVSGRFSVSFDTMTRYIFSDEFLTKNPAFEALKDKFAECKNTYQQELEKAGCACRMTSDWAKNCVSGVINILEAAKTNDHDTIRKFVRFVGRKGDEDDVDGLGVTLIIGANRHDISIVKTTNKV